MARASSESASFFAVPPAARLRWLVYLRWVALAGVAVGLGIAHLAQFPWVAPRPIALTLAVGILYNLAFLWRVRRLTHASGERGMPGVLDREHELQALADVGALTLLLLASGGVHNPICMFYGFHVVLGGMLGYRRGAMLAAVMGSAGIGLLVMAERSGLLLSPPLLSPPLWLMACAALATIFSLAHFSLSVLRFVEHEQGRALRNYDLLLTALDRLQVGLELVAPDGRLLLGNSRAVAIHPCPGGRWQMPAGLPTDAPAPGETRRFAYTEQRGESRETRIVEMLPLGGWGTDGVRAFLYVDRTEATVDEQRAIMLERLASLGRAMQEVAHELNTPLASIQTLAVDLSHALAHAAQSPDAAESVALIVDEARRCQQISRELLSTARTGSSSPVRTVLGEVVRRAARLTYGQRRSRVQVKGDPNITCITDSDRLLQILVNLLQNASDASDQPVEVTLSAHSDEPAYAEIAVRDFGPGLPREVQERMFVPFVSTKPPGQGTGLGLYTCSRLAQQLRAELHIENAATQGVLVRLRLPVSPAAPLSPEGAPCP